ncbi:MAG: hypothetical protein P8X76_12600 [Maritimibacter sp.]
MFAQMQRVRGVSAAQISKIRKIFQASGWAGQGNPAVTRHPMSPEQAQARLPQNAYSYYRNAQFERICGRPYMAPLYDPATQRPEDAKVCVDMFEYPNIPLAYPVTWVRAREAAELCWAEGKRIGDAHEWEGAAAGALLEPDYRFDLGTPQAMRAAHNAKYWPSRSWTYGPQWRSGICAQGSYKSSGCNGGSFSGCGSNTYPAGAFPDCHSSLGVYDLEGNAAEHMNLPLAPSQMASRGSTTLGVTEMKGSWFIRQSAFLGGRSGAARVCSPRQGGGDPPIYSEGRQMPGGLIKSVRQPTTMPGGTTGDARIRAFGDSMCRKSGGGAFERCV